MSLFSSFIGFFKPHHKNLVNREQLANKAKTVYSREEAIRHLDKMHQKISSLSIRFSNGGINKAQFTDLFKFYQAEISRLEQFINLYPDAENWQEVVNEGHSILIRRRLTAKLLGFSIYNQLSGLPLCTIGQFGLEPALFVPMLHAYQNATKEIFGAGMKSTEILDGQWVIFMPGTYTTTIALFIKEPSGDQIRKLENLHRVFEKANEKLLKLPKYNLCDLIVPHEYFLQHTF